MKRQRLTILGTGILGCTVAAVASSAGLAVRLIGRRQILDADAAADPTFASAFPVASIIPRSVGGEDVRGLLAISNAAFAALGARDAGIRQQLHFELSENPPSDPAADPAAAPEYAQELTDWKPYREWAGEATIPRRAAARALFGFGFRTWIADVPLYYPWLMRFLERAGVAIERRELSPGALDSIGDDCIVNCLGAGAHEVFPELDEGEYLRGILLHCDVDRQWVERKSGLPVSYNYKPAAEIYSHPGGREADLYFYPRLRTLVLGGLRQRGQWDAAARRWTGEPLDCPMLTIRGLEVPAPIWEVNRELIELLTGSPPPAPSRVLIGLRFLHHTAAGPGFQIAAREWHGRRVIDCFGFGGAGVTLSWGAACRALQLASQHLTGSPKFSAPQSMLDPLLRCLHAG